MPKYEKLTNDYAKWLFPLVSRIDWHYKAADGNVPRVNTTAIIEDFGGDADEREGRHIYPQRLTRTFLQAHLHHKEELHVIPNRKDGVALLMIDIDQHDGQTDGLEAATWIQSRYFPDAYLEPSRHGFHLYLLVNVGFCRSVVFNELMDRIQHQLQFMVMNMNFEATVEVKGRFVIRDKVTRFYAYAGQPFQSPVLPNGAADLKQLMAMKVYRPVVFNAIDKDAAVTLEVEAELDQKNGAIKQSSSIYAGSGNPVAKESACAWYRMKWATFDFTCQFHRLPDVTELLEHYQNVYQTDAGTRRRVYRARQAIRLRSKTFDLSKASEGGYLASRSLLMEAVKTYVTDRSSGYKYGISDEDLAITLYLFTRASFSIADDPKHQWTVGNNAIRSMFDTLKADGVTKRSCAMPNKQIALKLILQRAGLIECLDQKYVIGQHSNGISKKWVISHNHWRHAEFVRFSQNVKVVYADRIIDGIKKAKADRLEVESQHVVRCVMVDEWAAVA